MIQIVGELSKEFEEIIKKVFSEYDLSLEFTRIEDITSDKIISLDKQATIALEKMGRSFFNWDLLFSVLGANDSVGELENKINERVRILKSVLSLKSIPVGNEFHGSIRVHDLAESSRFYSWLFGVAPKEWTHRYVIFVRKDTNFNFVLLVADNKELNHDTLYHLGMGVDSRQSVVDFYHSAIENGFTIEKPPRTTWRGTPLHELWLKDPDGTLIEVYARLTEDELAEMPDDKEPVFLVAQ